LRFVPLFGLRFAVFFSLRHVWIPPTFHVLRLRTPSQACQLVA
jgi:hypothetical protein